jgi:hypothetical protein
MAFTCEPAAAYSDDGAERYVSNFVRSPLTVNLHGFLLNQPLRIAPAQSSG